jgi:citrate lyase beta subunit
VDGALDDGFLAEVDAWLAPADAQAALYPGEPGTRQPVHTVYVPATAYHPGTPAEWGRRALELLTTVSPARFAGMAGLAPVFVDEVYPRVTAKLDHQPIEDLRVDFEDGYGPRPDDQEDADADRAGSALAGERTVLMSGVRIKGLQAATRRRGLRTLERVVRAADGGLPERFVVTLPKVAHVAEVETAVRIVERLERAYRLPDGSLRLELQVELPQTVIGPDGVATVARLVHAGRGRCEGLHYGTYDFSAAAGVVALEQSLEHPLADHAKAVMQLAAAQTGVRVSDGSTNVIPVGEGIAHAWELHARLVRRSLRNGLFQGWDLHPGHLVTRFAATYEFYREQLQPSCARLRMYTERAGSGVMDEPATAFALAGVVLRALDCGAADDAEVHELAGLDRAGLGRLARRRN